jgi:hypothetical protein
VAAEAKSLSTLRIVRLCVLIAVALYFVESIRLPVSRHTTGLGKIEIVIALLALGCVNSVFYFDRKYVRKAEALLIDRPADERAIRRRRLGYMVIYAASLAVALYGLVLHLCGAPIAHIVPFFAVGALLIVWFRPRAQRDILE